MYIFSISCFILWVAPVLVGNMNMRLEKRTIIVLSMNFLYISIEYIVTCFCNKAHRMQQTGLFEEPEHTTHNELL